MNKEIIPEQLLSAFGNHTLPEAMVGGFEAGNESNIWNFRDALGTERIIKKYPTWVQETDIRWIHNYMNQLVVHNYPLTKPINEPITDGRNFFAVYESATGQRFNLNEPLHFSDMAVKLRLLHDIGRVIDLPGTRNWPTTYGYKIDQGLLKKVDLEGKGNLLVESWNLSQTLLATSSMQVIPIHGDFRSDNMRFDSHGVTKVFDFGNSRNDYPEVDMAITLRNITKDLGIGNQIDRQIAFIQKYNISGRDGVKVSPEGLCHSELILVIQECLYLWSGWKKSGNPELFEKFKSESNYLRQLQLLIPIQLNRLKK